MKVRAIKMEGVSPQTTTKKSTYSPLQSLTKSINENGTKRTSVGESAGKLAPSMTFFCFPEVSLRDVREAVLGSACSENSCRTYNPDE